MLVAVALLGIECFGGRGLCWAERGGHGVETASGRVNQARGQNLPTLGLAECNAHDRALCISEVRHRWRLERCLS